MAINLHSVKISVVLVFAVFAAFGFMFGGGIFGRSHASISGPPASHTGAPGELNCTDCHNAASGVGQLSIVAPASYTPGQTYQLQVRHATTDTTRKRWGFEMTALASNVMAGAFANVNTATQIVSGASKRYVEQTSTGTFQNQTGGATWTINWTAPATNVGPVTFYAAGIQSNNNGSESGDQTYLTNVVVPATPTVVIHHGFMDFDGDGKSDAGVFRPTGGEWYVNRSTAGFLAGQWGVSTDKPTPADFDGDDKTDIAVWREAGPGASAFFILLSSTNTVRAEQFGQAGDDPVAVGDWDGDGKADEAVYRDSAFGSQSFFYYRGSLNNPDGIITYYPWGMTGDKAVRGDFDGDGKNDPAVFRPSIGAWFIAQSSNGTVKVDLWGLAGDNLVPADYDGDGKTDIAVFRNGVWYIRQSSNGQNFISQWGLATDTLAPADYDGDGKTDLAIYRNGNWWIRQSNSGTFKVASWGLATDVPLQSVYVR
ncbi:hypothetical protein BH10ACI2_BH10ACI2_19970 [soil metagenome]